MPHMLRTSCEEDTAYTCEGLQACEEKTGLCEEPGVWRAVALRFVPINQDVIVDGMEDAKDNQDLLK